MSWKRSKIAKKRIQQQNNQTANCQRIEKSEPRHHQQVIDVDYNILYLSCVVVSTFKPIELMWWFRKRILYIRPVRWFFSLAAAFRLYYCYYYYYYCYYDYTSAYYAAFPSLSPTCCFDSVGRLVFLRFIRHKDLAQSSSRLLHNIIDQSPGSNAPLRNGVARLAWIKLSLFLFQPLLHNSILPNGREWE